MSNLTLVGVVFTMTINGAQVVPPKSMDMPTCNEMRNTIVAKLQHTPLHMSSKGDKIVIACLPLYVVTSTSGSEPSAPKITY